MNDHDSRLSSRRRLFTIGCQYLAISLLLTVPAVQAASGPVCPNEGEEPYPAPALVGQAPEVISWKDLSHLPRNCHVVLQGTAALSIAFSGQFSHAGPIEEIAERLGAISRSRNLLYWSVTDQDWRILVSDAFALDTADTDSARADFSAQEMLSGQVRYFAQNDTRSWGLNIYSFRAIQSSADHLVMDSNNLSAIRLGPLTLFDPDDVHSVLFIHRQDDTTWTYYSLSVIRHSTLTAREKSLINRQTAFYRLLIGQAPDQEPPQAP